MCDFFFLGNNNFVNFCYILEEICIGIIEFGYVIKDLVGCIKGLNNV